MCGGQFINSTVGNIISPDFPNGYPSYSRCSWFLSNDFIGPNYTWNITVHSFDLEQNADFVFISTPSGQQK